MKFSIKGEILSHKNLYRRAKWGGLYMSQKEEFEALLWQFKAQREGDAMTGKIKLILDVFGNDRKDLNNQIACICDLLEKSGIIKNDRQIKVIDARKHISKSAGAVIELVILQGVNNF